ncbi:flavoprotein [Streptomyces sp. DT171]|uniref:flavoprotein n=1 Tax=Streptomyces sp. DT171 TaxID=3416524 RepID=UPI003CF277CD
MAGHGGAVPTDGNAARCVAGAREPGPTRTKGPNWEVGVVATPQGLGFIDTAAVEEQTGYPIRSASRAPGEPRPLPPPDAVAVATATFDTINKWAAGASDTLALALGILCEAHGFGVPTAVLPYLNAAQAVRTAYRLSPDRLSGTGVLISSRKTHEPGTGGRPDRFRREEALEPLTPLTLWPFGP